MTPISIPIAKQPSMDLYTRSQMDEKPLIYQEHAHAHAHAHAHGMDDDVSQQWSSPASSSSLSHKPCHNGRLRRLLVPFLIALLTLSGLVALSCLFGDGSGTGPTDIIEGLLHVKRASDGSVSSGNESSFTKHKLYLIVIFVGLLVVLILGVMLSAWCCKGVFENPCCCPCYLCACCGGLACLECIGCGLCAEGVEQM
ncbi:hypothetical protein B0H10DRAFT_1976909 [Mycena sp. CBHHK59/15]|nr:hypothetical protein B0H10DRAFT_1976909 [Mycena sp. CBHHK59/15]